MTPLDTIARKSIEVTSSAISDPEISDGLLASWCKRKFDGEIAILKFITASCSDGVREIPSPRLIASHVDDDQTAAYALLEKLPGLPMVNIWGSMQESSKVGFQPRAFAILRSS
jgi:hypothetical protein